MYILSKQFSDKFNKQYTISMNDNKIDNNENGVFFKPKLMVFSDNTVFSNNNISINIYH